MKQLPYFLINTGYSIYICQEKSYDMYIVVRGESKHIWLQGPASAKAALEEGYKVAELSEEDIRGKGLWRGSFMRNKRAKRVERVER